MPLTAGLGFKLQHLDDALAATAPGLWFEVHAENYMVDGGPRLAALRALRDRFPISLHGVGLSLASPEPPSDSHLARLKILAERIEPFQMSDHLAWQKWAGAHHSDFLPFPRSAAALQIVIDNVDRVQTVLKRAILVENPSLYVDLLGHDFSEGEFLDALAKATGCGLLLDVNNLFVSAHNLDFNAEAALDAISPVLIQEVHLAGHSRDGDPSSGLLIDTHGAKVADPVWSLYRRLVERVGARPTLIERDDDIPAFDVLMRERDQAHHILRRRHVLV
jgi:uncharacterized protein (UPF0276 family)